MTNEERIQTEKTVLNMVGVNRSQARDALSSFAVERRQAQLQREAQGTPPPEPFQSITSTITAFERRPIQGAGQTPAAASRATGGTPIEVGGVFNGVATTATLLQA